MFVLGIPFQASLMFVSKAEANPSEAPFRCSALGWPSGLIHKHNTRLEILARDIHSSLLGSFESYEQNEML